MGTQDIDKVELLGVVYPITTRTTAVLEGIERRHHSTVIDGVHVDLRTEYDVGTAETTETALTLSAAAELVSIISAEIAYEIFERVYNTTVGEMLMVAQECQSDQDLADAIEHNVAFAKWTEAFGHMEA